MTIQTFVFNKDGKNGLVKKVGTAWFFDGYRQFERSLWYNAGDDKTYVILNREAYIFRAYFTQDVPGVIKGRI